jgi:membrane-associated phospholipid phosphatase
VATPSDHAEAPERARAAQPVLVPPVPPGSGITFGDPKPTNPFTAIPRDLKRFFSKDTAAVMGIFGPAAGAAYSWDQAGIHESQEHLSKPAFEPGNIGGGFAVQAGAALGTWAIGKMAGHRKTAEVGGDLLRAQVVSQVMVQGIKLATGRQRPDGSDGRAFPSGHTASAFAMASVLDRHFGLKVGVPTYAFATYVALARLSANKHHMSDVLMGAGLGIAAGRTVTMGIAGAKFDMGVAPTQGGAAVTFTKR